MSPTPSIQTGDSRDRVLSLMGEPGDRQFNGENEALQYCVNRRFPFTTPEYTAVWLFSGRVTGVTTYRGAPNSSCRANYKTLEWPVRRGGPTADVAAATRSDSVASERSRAEQGDAAAQYALGYRYANGSGVAVDHGQAVVWYRRAADQGYAYAEHGLAFAYYNGLGVPRDEREAVRLYRKAAEQGVTTSSRNLAIAYLNGRGVPVDSVEAVEWFRRAAESDDDVSQFWLALLLGGEEEPGMTANLRESAKWLLRSAEQGYSLAQVGLAGAYFEGYGVQVDYVTGYMWLVLGAESRAREGSPVPPSSFTEIEAKMTPAQIAEARRRAAAWRPAKP